MKRLFQLFIALSFSTLAMSSPQVARGTFETKLAPQSDDSHPAGRMTIDKKYAGDLAGTGVGQMLSHRTKVKGSAGYVAIEFVTAILDGKSGSFALQHTGLMNRGEQSLIVSIIPDSGTGDLAGIAGSFSIDSSKSPHSYTFEYDFPE